MLMFTFKIEMAADLVVTDDIDQDADAEKLATKAKAYADADADADAGKNYADLALQQLVDEGWQLTTFRCWCLKTTDADAGKSDAGRNRVVTDDHDAEAGPHSLPPAFLWSRSAKHQGHPSRHQQLTISASSLSSASNDVGNQRERLAKGKMRRATVEGY